MPVSTVSNSVPSSITTLQGALLACVQGFTDALASLERILLTPIPWSYAAHIYEVAWLYCIILVRRFAASVSIEKRLIVLLYSLSNCTKLSDGS